MDNQPTTPSGIEAVRQYGYLHRELNERRTRDSVETDDGEDLVAYRRLIRAIELEAIATSGAGRL